MLRVNHPPPRDRWGPWGCPALAGGAPVSWAVATSSVTKGLEDTGAGGGGGWGGWGLSPTAAICAPPALPGAGGGGLQCPGWLVRAEPFCSGFSLLGKQKGAGGGGGLAPELGPSLGARGGGQVGAGEGCPPPPGSPSPGLAASPEVAARREDTRPVLPPPPCLPAPPPRPRTSFLHPRSPPQRRRLLPAVPPGQPLRSRCGEEGSGKGSGGEMAAGARRPPRHLLPPGPPPCTPAPLPLPPSSAAVPASSRRCRVAAAAAKDEPGPTAGAGPPRQPRRVPSLPLGAAPEEEKRAGKSRASGGSRSPAGAPGHVGAEQRRSRKYRAGWGQRGPRRAVPPPRHRRQELLRIGFGVFWRVGGLSWPFPSTPASPRIPESSCSLSRPAGGDEPQIWALCWGVFRRVGGKKKRGDLPGGHRPYVPSTRPHPHPATLRNPAAGRTLGVYFWLIHIRPF